MEKEMTSGLVLQKTGAGILPVEVSMENGDYAITMTQGKVQVEEPLSFPVQSDIREALGIPSEKLNKDCPIAIASTGHSKVMIGITDLKLLHRLRPDMAKLTQISSRIGCNGYYVFTIHPEAQPLVHGRMFAPAIGICEDPVTGNANGPLGAYLVTYGLFGKGETSFAFEALQGEAIGRAGTVGVFVTILNGKPVEVKITGEAVVAFSTEMEIEC